MHKIALMTAVGEDLPFAIGKGLAPDEVRGDEAVETLTESLGFLLLQKSAILQGGLSRRIGERRADETEEDYLKRALTLNTPIVNAAIAWTNNAQKKVRKFLRGEWNDEKSPYGSSRISFAQGTTQPGSAAMREITVTDAHGRTWPPDTPFVTPRGDDTGEEPKPVVNTAFDADVWPHVSDKHEAPAAALQKVIDETTQAPGARGSSRRRRRRSRSPLTRSSSRGRDRRGPGRIVAEAGGVRRRSVRRPPADADGRRDDRREPGKAQPRGYGDRGRAGNNPPGVGGGQGRGDPDRRSRDRGGEARPGVGAPCAGPRPCRARRPCEARRT